MSDIVYRLRQQARIEAKKYGDQADLQLEWQAAEELERLRDEVDRLKWRLLVEVRERELKETAP